MATNVPILVLAITALITVFSNMASSMISPISTSVSPKSTSSNDEPDELALLDLKNHITQDPHGFLSSWNESLHFCNWSGVRCSHRHKGRVTFLNLMDNELVGDMPGSIGNLTFLQYFYLGNNRFRGQIPQEVGRLYRLKYLNLSFNEIEGEIPVNLTSCSELLGIALSNNKLVGKIPTNIKSPLKKMHSLELQLNNLQGSIPKWLGNLTSLEEVSIAYNNLDGTIPAELGKISGLKFLQVSTNSLSGVIPTEIYNLTSLEILDLGNNRLHGVIQADIAFSLPNLQGLYLGRNRFTGQIPLSLTNASDLVELDLSGNSFIGEPPPDLGRFKMLTRILISGNQLTNAKERGLGFLTSLANCSNLWMLDISENKFEGVLPPSIANLSSTLEWLVLGSNHIYGNIPDGIENLSSMAGFSISGTSITGKIPETIGKLPALVEIDLSRNIISGAIPASLGNISLLMRLYLQENNLQGHIPTSLGNSHQLETLLLFYNNLNGTIPKEIASFLSLLTLNIGKNSLEGPLPQALGNMTKLLELDVSDNRLTGGVPATLASCLMIETINLSSNSFEGIIPSSLSSLKSLQFLDLSYNNLSGQIPGYLQNFTLLQKLNLSFNKLEGQVPSEGAFRNTSIVSIIGNKNLCGGIKELALPPCETTAVKRHRRFSGLKIVIPVTVSSLILLACLIIIFKRVRDAKSISSPEQEVKENFPKVSYQDLSQATNGFSSSNLIGQGSCGSVYKGTLGEDRVMVAIKVLNLSQKGALKSFIAECQALRNIRHRNLLRIITVCSTIDFKRADFKALVYDFMPNGSIDEWLHPNADGTEMKRLSLIQRLNISIDVASAIEYLHNHSHIPIIHGDLKPSNVLLDHDMVAHVGDFGLARFRPTNPPYTYSQNQSSSSEVKGTVGYVAPEYGMGGKPSKAGDAYSFGILLLEMFSGTRPTDGMFKDGMSLQEFGKRSLQGRVEEFVEPLLLQEVQEMRNRRDIAENRRAAAEANFDSLTAILRIGVVCSLQNPSERLEMKVAVTELDRIRKAIAATIIREGITAERN